MHMCERTQRPTRAPNAFYLENFSTSYRFSVDHLPQLSPAVYLFVMLLMLINIIYNSLHSKSAGTFPSLLCFLSVVSHMGQQALMPDLPT